MNDESYESSAMGLRARFGVFELDLSGAELWRGGRRISLAPQPARLLVQLVKNSGKLVTHEEIKTALWPDGVVRDFEQGVHTAIRQVRSALHDVAAASRYVETVPRRGYRFIAPVEFLPDSPSHTAVGDTNAPSTSDDRAAPDSSKVSNSDESEPPKSASRKLMSWQRGFVIVAGIGATIWFVQQGTRDPTDDAKLLSGVQAWTRRDDPRTFVAVLPFANLTGDENNIALADGMTEELISCLGRVHPQSLGVIARSSVVPLRNDNCTLAEIQESLQVDYVVEGSVRLRDDQVRIEARLVDATDGVAIWSEGYWRRHGDLYALHNEISARIAGKLAIKALPAAPHVMEALGSSNDEAYTHYLNGRHAWHRFDRLGLRESVTSYAKAIAADPLFGQAYGAMAESWALLAMNGEDPAIAYGNAERAANRALEISDAIPSAWNALGFVRLYRDWNWISSDRAFRQAVNLDPGYAMAHHWYAGLLSAVEHHDDAIAQVIAAMELDPQSLSVRSDLVWYYLYADRYEDARREAKRTLAVDPDYHWARFGLFYANLRLNQFEPALQLVLEFHENAADSRMKEIEGKSAEQALTILFRYRLGDVFADDRLDAFEIACASGEAEQIDAGLESLRQAISNRQIWTTFARVDPRLDPLRQHPRFSETLAEHGLGGEVPPSLNR